MILVTGAGGFIARSLIDQLHVKGCSVNGSSRTLAYKNDKYKLIQIPTLSKDTNWSKALHSCDIVVHLAAKAHKSHEKKSEQLSEYIESNCDATINLARQAHKAGVKRFIFLSSTGVMGKQVTYGIPYSIKNKFNPHDFYTESKMYAEQKLLDFSKECSMEIIIIRAPVVYGPNAPGSVGALSKAIRMRVPLPFGSIFNRRHLISIYNLVDLIYSCIISKTSVSGVYIASDNEPISTKDLCYICGQYEGIYPRFISIPKKFLMFFAHLLGAQKKADTLFNDFELDCSETILKLNWLPIYSPGKELAEIKRECK